MEGPSRTRALPFPEIWVRGAVTALKWMSYNAANPKIWRSQNTSLGQRLWLSLCFGIALGWMSQGTSARGAKGNQSSSLHQVQQAYRDLNQWLGDGANGAAWRDYLDTPKLEAQMALGGEAEPAALQQVASRFSTDAAGLEKRRFVTLRSALQGWISELKQVRRRDLPELARASRSDYRDVSLAEIRLLRDRLRQDAQQLESRLVPQSKLARGWFDYLYWERLAPHLELDSIPSFASLAQLENVSRRLRSNAPGLEQDVFVAVADSLDAYREMAPWAREVEAGQHERRYERNLQQMAEQLDRHLQRPTAETSWKIGRILGQVDRLGDSPELVEEVRKRLVQPNVHAYIAANLLNRRRQTPVDTVRPVRDVILGTRIFGTARMVGRLRFEAVPSEQHAELNVLLEGSAASQTVGYNGPARIRSVGNTAISASKRIFLADDRFYASPATAQARTRTRILSVDKTGGGLGRRLVAKVGKRRAAQQKTAAEKISSRHAADRAADNFEQEVSTALAEGRRNYEKSVRLPLLRRGFLPKDMRLSTTSSHVAIAATFALQNQLAASGPVPARDASCDISVQVHESALSNYLAIALSGVTIGQVAVDRPLEVTGDAPPWMKKASLHAPKGNKPPQAPSGPEFPSIESDKKSSNATDSMPFKPWSLTLSRATPISVTLAEGVVSLRIRTAILRSAEDEYEDWDFLVSYRLERQGNGIALKRAGPIEVFPLGFDPEWDTKLTSQESAFRNTLAKNMNARADAGKGFPDQIPIDPIHLADGTELTLNQLASEAGWLTIGWTLSAAPR